MTETKEQRAVATARRLAELRSNPYDPRHGTTTGYNYGCKCEPCKAAKRDYYQAPRVLAMRADSARKYEARRRRDPERSAKRAEDHRDWRLRQKYPDLGGNVGWQRLWDAQNGLCAACGEPMTRRTGRAKRLTDAQVDHEWRTELTNALLCSLCNVTAGQYNNDASRIVGLARYVDTYHSADFFPERTSAS